MKWTEGGIPEAMLARCDCGSVPSLHSADQDSTLERAELRSAFSREVPRPVDTLTQWAWCSALPRVHSQLCQRGHMRNPL